MTKILLLFFKFSHQPPFRQLPGGMRSFGIVAAALEGLPVDLLDKPFNCEKSYDELLLTGVYPFRDSKSNESFVPRLSLFQIVEWCTRTLKNPPANSRDLQCFFIILHDINVFVYINLIYVQGLLIFTVDLCTLTGLVQF